MKANVDLKKALINSAFMWKDHHVNSNCFSRALKIVYVFKQYKQKPAADREDGISLYELISTYRDHLVHVPVIFHLSLLIAITEWDPGDISHPLSWSLCLVSHRPHPSPCQVQMFLSSIFSSIHHSTNIYGVLTVCHRCSRTLGHDSELHSNGGGGGV